MITFPKARNSSPARAASGFTLVELLAVAATLALLAALLLPALANTKEGDRSGECLSNKRELGLAWSLYWSENNGLLPQNNFQSDPHLPASWCTGMMDFSQSAPDNTNTLNLSKGQLGPYVKSVSVYKCPGDRSLSGGRTGLPRVRSISMNSYIGVTAAGVWTPGYRVFLKISDFTFHPASQEFVFLDERADSINDPLFVVSMGGYDPSSPTQYQMVDFPGLYHNRAATLSFADGHAEVHGWSDPRTIGQASESGIPVLNISHPNSPDVAWLQDHASYRAANPGR